MSSDNSALASASQFMSVSCHLTQSTVFNKAKDTSWLTILPLPFENILYNTPNASSMYIWHLVLCTSSFTSTFIFKASLEKSDTCWMSEHNFTSPKTHQYCISHTSWNQLKKNDILKWIVAHWDFIVPELLMICETHSEKWFLAKWHST